MASLSESVKSEESKSEEVCTTDKKSTWLKLNNGTAIPPVGFGLWMVSESEMTQVIRDAYETGYRLFDGASFYGNEAAFGRALKTLGIPRESIFVQSKCWNSEQGYSQCIESCKKSLNDTGLDYFDIFMVHWPVPDLHTDTYRACLKLLSDGLCRSIGVSNYTLDDFTELCESLRMKSTDDDESKVVLMDDSSTVIDAQFVKDKLKLSVNQLYINPLYYDASLMDHFSSLGVCIQAYKPLERASDDLLKNETVMRIAKETKLSAAQVCLKWNNQHGFITLIKSKNVRRMQENMDAFLTDRTGVLTVDQMRSLDTSLCSSEYRLKWKIRQDKSKIKDSPKLTE